MLAVPTPTWLAVLSSVLLVLPLSFCKHLLSDVDSIHFTTCMAGLAKAREARVGRFQTQGEEIMGMLGFGDHSIAHFVRSKETSMY